MHASVPDAPFPRPIPFACVALHRFFGFCGRSRSLFHSILFGKASRVRHTRTCCSQGAGGHDVRECFVCHADAQQRSRARVRNPGLHREATPSLVQLAGCANAQTAVYRHAFAGTCGAGEPPAHAEHHQRARTPTHCCPFSCLFDAPLRVASASVQMFSDLRSLHQLTQTLKGDGVFEVSRLCVVTVPRASARLPVSMSQS